jgi:DNA-binding transcriptional ArsR family regulator
MLSVARLTKQEVSAKFFRGLADSSRLSILQLLVDGPFNVGEIVEATGLTQSNVSNHLSCLRDCGLVAGTRQGRHVLYELSDGRVAELLETAERLLADVARGVYDCVRYGREEA